LAIGAPVFGDAAGMFGEAPTRDAGAPEIDARQSDHGCPSPSPTRATFPEAAMIPVVDLLRCCRRAVLCAALAAPHAVALTLLTEENPPFNYTEDGKVVGSATEIVAAVVQRTGLSVRQELLPWDTAFRRAQAEKDTCVFATARLENRERLFVWIGPLANSFWGVFARSNFSQPIRVLSDLKPYRIGGVVNDAKMEYLQENNVTNTKALAEDRFNPPRLLLPTEDPNRIDLWITNLYSGQKVAQAAKVPDLKLVFVAREVPVYLACSPQSSPATIKALTDAFEQVQASGLPARVVAEYEKKFGR
jgi:polar amino acid transport system substrate-binding protein